MKYLQILNLAIAALAATFALVLAVVAILYGFNLDKSAAIGRELPSLIGLVALFVICAIAATAAWWSRHSLKSWAGWMQAGAVSLVVLCSAGVGQILGIIR